MKKFALQYMLFIIFMILQLGAKSQATLLGNNTILPNRYLGWDASTTADLQIKHNAPNQPIIFSTSNVEAMRIHPDRKISLGTPLINNHARLTILQSSKTRGITAYNSNMDNNYTNISIESSIVLGTNQTTNARNFGIKAISVANNSQKYNIGVDGFANYGQSNYGVYAFAPIAPNNLAGFFNGDVLYIGGSFTFSDLNLKINIEPIENSRELLLSLNPKRYYFNSEVENLNLPENEQFGFIAQEIQEVFPHLVREIHSPSYPISDTEEDVSALDFKAVNYTQIIPLLLGCSKTQDQMIEANGTSIQEILFRVDLLENSLIKDDASSDPNHN